MELNRLAAALRTAEAREARLRCVLVPVRLALLVHARDVHTHRRDRLAREGMLREALVMECVAADVKGWRCVDLCPVFLFTFVSPYPSAACSGWEGQR